MATYSYVGRRGAVTAAQSERTVLFLSPHGAARAVIATAIVNRFPAAGLKAYAAGVDGAGAADPIALEMLRAFGCRTRSLRPTPLASLEDSGAQIDYVIALWDRAADEPYPTWARRPAAASWATPNPRDPAGEGRGLVATRRAFVETYQLLQTRVAGFVDQVVLDEADFAGRRRRDRRAGAVPGPGVYGGDVGHPLNLTGARLALRGPSVL